MASFQESQLQNDDKLEISSASFLPENSTERNIALFSKILNLALSSVHVSDMSGAGGFSGEMSRVSLRWTDAVSGKEEEKVLVMKKTKLNGIVQSKALGLAREACFYEWVNQNKSTLYDELLPVIFYSKGNMDTGDKVILLEDLSLFAQSGYFFGGGSPLNWGRDLEKDVKSKGLSLISPSPQESTPPNPSITELVAEAACLLAARYHGQHWMRKDLLEDSRNWLKASDWYNGKGEVSWQTGQNYIRDMWVKVKETKVSADNAECKYSPYIVGLIDAAIDKISWDNYQTRIQNSHFTLAHGDFHPANMMCTFDNDLFLSGNLLAENISIRLLDWEVVGLGSGAQDIGQYFISHMTPEARRQCEDRLLRVYYNKLMETISARDNDLEDNFDQLVVSGRGEYSFELCQHEYIYGGVERWMFLLVVLANMCPDSMQQYFLNQVEAFARDHGVTAESIGMSRL